MTLKQQLKDLMQIQNEYNLQLTRILGSLATPPLKDEVADEAAKIDFEIADTSVEEDAVVMVGDRTVHPVDLAKGLEVPTENVLYCRTTNILDELNLECNPNFIDDGTTKLVWAKPRRYARLLGKGLLTVQYYEYNELSAVIRHAHDRGRYRYKTI